MTQEEEENIVRKSSELLWLNVKKIVTFSDNSKPIPLSKVVVCRITYLYFSRALARPDLASDFHIYLSIINFRSSSSSPSSHSQSCFSVSINVFDCLTLVRVPCFGVHRIKLCATSSGCLTQCPDSLIRIYFIISEIFGIPLYNLSLVNFSFHDMLEAILNNLV